VSRAVDAAIGRYEVMTLGDPTSWTNVPIVMCGKLTPLTTIGESPSHEHKTPV